jgi:FKBP-type peptidyl-prolyl cis-trans isomerase (trigger factor)
LVRHAPSVAAKRVSIWSLRRETFEPPQRLLTIEVDNARKQIVQARGMCNQMAGYTEQQMVERWAHEAGLQLGAYVWQKAW